MTTRNRCTGGKIAAAHRGQGRSRTRSPRPLIARARAMALMFPIAALLCTATPAAALDPACEAYLRAAEKSAQQPARHSVTETGGMRMEMIIAGGKTYMNADGKWMALGGNNAKQLAAERNLVASIRSGKYPITGCRKLGPQVVDGVPTTAYAYVLKMGGSSGEAKAFVSADGLVVAQSTSDSKVRHRYRGVTAPAL